MFSYRKGYVDQKIEVPCGKCIGCRLKRSLDWAIRCMHESTLWEQNTYITLTYDEKHCPGSVSVSDVQKFIKRLRKYYAPRKIRYFAGAEYGSKTQRPHYHLLLFNCDFTDKRPVPSDQNNQLYVSQILTDIWGKGSTTIGDVTQQSCQYVAKYVVKKISGDMAKRKYGNKNPEFGLMSRKPGIGQKWIEENYNDVYPNDILITKNYKIARPPKYYDKYYEKITQKNCEIFFTKTYSPEYNKITQNRCEKGSAIRRHRKERGSYPCITARIKEAQIALYQTKL